MNFADIYRERCQVNSDISDHLPTLYEHAAIGDAKVIELGVRSGESTFAFLAAIAEHGGSLWSCDIDRPPFYLQVQEHAPFWTFVLGDDLWSCAAAPDDADVVFIDTSHTYDQTVAELDLYAPKLRAGGVILLHDTELRQPAASPRHDPLFPVRVAAEEFAAESGWDLELVPGCNGLGIIRRPVE